MPPIICIVGKSGAGKTFLIERLVAELKRRRYQVATIKHDVHGFELDQPGKDSWRHTQAGSDAVVISSPEKLALIRKVARDSTLAELSRLIGEDFDIIVAEGFKQSQAPKIEVHRRELGEGLLCTAEELLALVTDEPLDISVPRYSPDEVLGLVDLIEKRFLAREEEERIALFVNEKPIPLNPFARSIIIKTLLGLVSALRGAEEAKSLDISVRRRGQHKR